MKINSNRWFRTGGGRIAIIFLMQSFLLGMKIFTPSGLVLAADVELLTPQMDATVLARNPEIHVVLRKSSTGGPNQIRVEKSGAMLKPVVAMEGEEHIYLHFRLPLTPGPNKFSIVPGAQQLKFTYQPVQGLLPLNMKNFYFFHQEDHLPESCVDCHDLQETGTIALIGLQQQTSCVTCHQNLFHKNIWPHSPAVNQQCLTCHQQSGSPWKIGFREGRIDETCFACHTSKKEWQSSKHRHGALIGGCTLCHNPHSTANRYQLWAEDSLILCITCHDDKKNLLDKENPVPYVHGIIFGKGCVSCHDPHATDNSYMLQKPINELCNGCHQVLPAGSKVGHPMPRHPIEAPSELRRPGRKLTCVGCHDPHGSNYQYMLIESKLGGSLCRVCHKR